MSTILECIVDVCLPIAGRWIILQIASLFGVDLNTSTLLWFLTIVLCAIISESFTFQSKKKWARHQKKTDEPEASETSESEESPKVQSVELWFWCRNNETPRSTPCYYYKTWCASFYLFLIIILILL